MGVSGRHFIGLLSGGFLVIIATKGSSKVSQGPSPPLLSLPVILIHCVTVATVTTPTKTKKEAKKNKQEFFLEFQRLTNGTNPWEKIKTKRNEMKQNLTPNQLNYENKMEMKPLSLGLWQQQSNQSKDSLGLLLFPFLFFLSQNRHIMLVNYSC